MSKCDINLIRNIQSFSRDMAEPNPDPIQSFKVFVAGTKDIENDIDTVIAPLFVALHAAKAGSNFANQLVKAAISGKDIIQEIQEITGKELSDDYVINSKFIRALDGNIITFGDFKSFLKKELETFTQNTIDISEQTKVDSDFTEIFDIDTQTEEQIKTDEIIISNDTFDNNLTVLNEKKLRRKKAVEGLKDGSFIVWTEFLNVYFPGMAAYGAEFTEWVKNKFYDKFIDFNPNNPEGGFMSNINTIIDEIRQEVFENKASLKELASYDALTDADLKDKFDSDDGGTLKHRYFHDVLYSEFNFIIKSIVPIIAVDVKAIQKNNIKVHNVVFDDGSNIKGLYWNMHVDLMRDFTAYPEDNAIVADDTIIVTKVETDTTAFIDNLSNYEKGNYYYIVNDNKYFYYKDENTVYDLSPKIYYKFNSKNDRNTDSIDHFVNPLGQGTAFINNFMSLLRYIKKDGSLGKRMNIEDFMYVSPYIFGDGVKDIQELKESMSRFLKKDDRLGDIVRSLYTHVFADDFTNPEIKSLRAFGGKINNDIVNALFSAITSKFHEKFMFLDDGRLKISKELSPDNFKDVIDESLARYLTVKGVTKPVIANRIQITKDPKSGLNTEIRLFKTTGFTGDSISLKNISSFNTVKIYASIFGLDSVINEIYNKASEVFPHTNKATDFTIKVFKDLITVAAANIVDTETRFDTSVLNNRYNDSKDYRVLKPTSLLYSSDEITILSSLFEPEVTKNVTIAKAKRQQAVLPNRNSYLNRIINKFKTEGRAESKSTFNPFLNEDLLPEDHDYIPTAKYKGYYIKSPIVAGDKTVKVADWVKRNRYEFAMINGFLVGPKNNGVLGKTFFIQATNYSDKGNPHLFKIEIDGPSLLNPSKETKEKLINYFIKYNLHKSLDLQKIILDNFSSFLGKNLNSIIDSITGPDRGERIKMLLDLYEQLVINNDYGTNPNMLKDINLKLDKIKIDSDLVMYNETDMVKDADYVILRGNNHINLKPDVGLRAEFYSDTDRAKERVLKSLERHRDKMKKLGIDSEKITNTINQVNRQANTVKGDSSISGLSYDDFLDRFYLINNIYGHAMKVISMGDETAFKRKSYGKFSSMEEYYASKPNGLEGHKQMLTDQFKRAQSNLTSGTSYIQKETLTGLRKKYNRKNFLAYLDIMSNSTEGRYFKFKELEGKTIHELLGYGVLVPFEDGAFIRGHEIEGKITFQVRARIGDSIVTISDSSDPDALAELFKSEGLPPEFFDAIIDLLYDAISIPSEIKAIEDYGRADDIARHVESLNPTGGVITLSNGIKYDIGKQEFIKKDGSVYSRAPKGSKKLFISEVLPIVDQETFSRLIDAIPEYEGEEDTIETLLTRIKFDKESLARLVGKNIIDEYKQFYTTKPKEGKSIDDVVLWLEGDYGIEATESDIAEALDNIRLNKQFESEANFLRNYAKDTGVTPEELIELLRNGESKFYEESVRRQQKYFPDQFEDSIEENDIKNNISFHEILEKFEDSSEHITMPDYINDILVTDPTSYINLVGLTDKIQENVDGVQFVHPLLNKILEYARGGEFGAFNTEFQEAQKMITSTFNYKSFRHALQKKSVQNVFTLEQMRRLGSVDLYNTFKKMNTAIEFNRKNMMVPDGAGGMVEKDFNNLQELFEYLGGNSATTEDIWEKVIDVLKRYPTNLFNFVGYLTFTSAQKTSHQNLNKVEDIFSPKDVKLNIQHTANEYNFETLTKAHSYDVTRGSTITLLSQLVNAIAFGGITTFETSVLQNAMSSMMLVNRAALGKEMAAIATKHKELNNDSDYDIIIDKLSNGEFYINNLNSKQEKFYEDIIKESVQQMSELAFNEGVDSDLIKEIITNSELSLDTPSVYKRVIGTLRSGLFKDTVKLKMKGFIATVSAAIHSVTIFTTPIDTRVSRESYILGALTGAYDITQDPKYGRIEVVTSDAELEMIKNDFTPLDNVKVVYTDGSYEIKPFSDVAKINSDISEIHIVITPDRTIESEIKLDNYAALDPTDIITINEGGDTKHLYKWYIDETYDSKELTDLISDGRLTLNTAEKFTLDWIKYIDKDGNSIENSEAFKNLYRASIEGNEDAITKAKGELFLELKRKTEDGENYWKTKPAEIVLPSFMRGFFNIPIEASLHEIIGYDGNVRLNALKYFKKSLNLHRFNLPLRKPVVQLQKMLDSKMLYNYDNYLIKIKGVLDNSTNTKLSAAEQRAIRAILKEAKNAYVEKATDSFLELLDVVATRIPGQSKQSGFSARVIEFLNSQGNAAFAPTEHMVTTGGDLDIDTLSILTASLDNDGNILKGDKYTSNGKTFNTELFIHDFISSYNDLEVSIKDYVSKHNLSLQEKNDRDNDKINELLNNDKLKPEEKAKEISKLEKRIENRNSRVIGPEKTFELIKKARRILVKQFENISANSIKDSISQALTNIHAAVEVNTPMTLSMFGPIIDMVQSFSDENQDDIDTNGEDYTAIYEAEDVAAQGKESIGVYATVLKITSAIQAAKIEYDNEYSASIQKIGNIGTTLTDISAAQTGKEGTFTIYYESPKQISSTQMVSSFKQQVGKEYYDGLVFRATPKKVKGLNNQRVFNVRLHNPYVVDTSTDSSVNEGNIKAIIEKAKDAGYDGVIIRDSSNYNDSPNIIVFDGNIIQDVKETNKAIYNPFEFKHSITYFDKELQKEITKHRTTFADLDEHKLRDIIDKNPALTDLLNDLNDASTEFDTNAYNILKADFFRYIRSITGKRKLSRGEFSEVIKDLFNIDMTVSPEETFEEAFERVFEADENTLISAYLYLFGKQLSNDISSQFLSAATDNAKELILGKIRSNIITNSVITTMLIMGYDVNTIIKFLFDPQFDKILEEFIEKGANFESTRLTSKNISKIAEGKFAESLASILDISEEIAKFRGVRSLQENFTIDQFALDKILDDVSEELYDSIMKNDINLIDTSSLDDAQKVFYPDMFIFLHPQSRSLFVNIVDNEVLYLPHVFKTINAIRHATPANIDKKENVYKNIEAFISESLVERFLISRDFKANIVLRNELKAVSVKYKKERSEFVRNFNDYLNFEFNLIRSLTGKDVALQKYIQTVQPYDSDFSIISFPKYRAANADPVEVGMLVDALRDLLVKTNDTKLNEVKKRLYDNFSIYALIVSRGQVKKGHIIDLFKEINLDFASYINTLSEEQFKKLFPELDPILDVIKDTLIDKDTLIALNSEDEGFYGEGMEVGNEEIYEPIIEEPYEGEMEGHEGDGSYFGPTISERVFYPEETLPFTVNTLYKINLPEYGKNNIFIGKGTIKEIAYRVFDSDGKETLPITSIEEDIMFEGLDRNLVRQLNSVGKQIGLDTTYGGGSRILAFRGMREGANGIYYNEYIVYNKLKNAIEYVPDIVLLYSDPDIFLRGNIIEKTNNRNQATRDILHPNLKAAISENKFKVTTINKKAVTIDSKLSNIITKNELKESHISDYVSAINTRGTSLMRLKYDTASVDETYKKLHDKTDVIPTAGKNSKDVVVPSMPVGKIGSDLINEEILYDLESSVIDILNNLAIGKLGVVNFYGHYNLNLKENTYRGDKYLPDSFNVGGLNVVESVLSLIGYDPKKDYSKPTTIGNYRVQRVIDGDNSFIKIGLIKENKNRIFTIANNKLHALNVIIDKDGVVKVNKKVNNDFSSVIKGIYEGKLNYVTKIVDIEIDNKIQKFMVLGDNNNVIILLENVDKPSFKAYKVKQEQVNDNYLDDKKNQYIVTSNTYNDLKSKINTKPREENNKNC